MIYKKERDLNLLELKAKVKEHVKVLTKEGMENHPHDFRDILIATLVTLFNGMPDNYFAEMMRYDSTSCGHHPGCKCQEELSVPSMKLFEHLRTFQRNWEAEQETKEGVTTVQE